MNHEILALIPATYSGDQESVSHAEARLLELSSQSDFVPSLLEIISSASTDLSIKQGAIIFLRNMVITSWNESFTQEIKQIIIQSLVEIIANASQHERKLVINLTKYVVQYAFFNGEWDSLIPQIEGLISGDKNHIRTGLVMARALSTYLRATSNDIYQDLYHNFFITIITSSLPIIHESNNYELISLCYHILYNLLLAKWLPNYDEIGNLISPYILKSFTIFNINKSPFFIDFLIRSLKFSQELVQRYGNHENFTIDIFSNYIEVIRTLFPMPMNPKIRCYLLKLLSEILKISKSWVLFCNDLVLFLKEMILPNFNLLNEEVQMVENDIAGFVQELHRVDVNFEDFRAAAGDILYKCADEHTEIIDAVMSIAGEAFDLFAGTNLPSIEHQKTVFSAFYMLTVVVRNVIDIDPNVVSNLIIAISPLFESPYLLARASAFMLLSFCTKIHFPQELVIVCIQHMMDESPLVQFYADITAPYLLKRIDNPKSYSAILEKDGPFDHLLQLSSVLEHPDLIDSIATIVDTFPDDLIPYAVSLGEQLLVVLINSAVTNSADQAIEVVKSFEILVDSIKKNSQIVNDYLPILFMKSLEVLKVLSDGILFDSFVIVVGIIVSNVSFQECFWEAAPVVVSRLQDGSNISVSDFIDIPVRLVYMDINLASRTELVQFLLDFSINSLRNKIQEGDEWNEYAKLSASLILRLTMSKLDQEYFNEVVQLTMLEIEQTSNVMIYNTAGLTMLVNALVFSGLGQLMTVLGPKFPIFIDYWIENPIFPETVFTALSVYSSFDANSDIQLRVLVSITTMMSEDILLKNSNCNVDEFDQEAELQSTCVWFDFVDTLTMFYNFITNLEQSNPEFYQMFVDEMDEDDLNQLGNLTNVIQYYQEAKNEKEARLS